MFKCGDGDGDGDGDGGGGGGGRLGKARRYDTSDANGCNEM